MLSRRIRTIILLFLCGIIAVLCMPYVIMKISDANIASFPRKVASTEYHIETSAEDVPYVGHIINAYIKYANSKKGTGLIYSDKDETIHMDECIDIAHAELQELTNKGVINPLWIDEELQSFMESEYLSPRRYYSRDESEGISFLVMWWCSEDKSRNLRLIYDQKYKRLLEVYYYGKAQFFATDDMEKLCNSFVAYQGLDILEDWSFNGKRLISQKASLSIECDQNDNGAGIDIIPTELILLGY